MASDKFRWLMLTAMALLCFSANSVLCRLALRTTSIDAISFTLIRLFAGAITLSILVRFHPARFLRSGDWKSAIALFAYAIFFSLSYRSLPTGTGALLLFGSVQATMLLVGLWRGERLGVFQLLGLATAMAGLIFLLLPGVEMPSLLDAASMTLAGAAWGVYSLRGRGTKDPIGITAGNFLRAAVLALGVKLVAVPLVALDRNGIFFAILSGSIASGLGYSIWYTALRGHSAVSAATVQLSVPLFAAAGGILLLGEQVTVRLALSTVAILGGIGFVIFNGPKKK